MLYQKEQNRKTKYFISGNYYPISLQTKATNK